MNVLLAVSTVRTLMVGNLSVPVDMCSEQCRIYFLVSSLGGMNLADTMSLHRSIGLRMHSSSLTSGAHDGVSEIDLSPYGTTCATTCGTGTFKQYTVMEFVHVRLLFKSFGALSSLWFVRQTIIPTALTCVAGVISISFFLRHSWHLRYSQDVLLGGMRFFHESFKISRLLYRRICANSFLHMGHVHMPIFSLSPANSLKVRGLIFLTQVPGTAA